LSLFVLILRTFLNILNEKSREKGKSIPLSVLIFIFVAIIVMYVLEIAVETLNSYVMIYSSLFGQGYKKSMKESFKVMKNRKSMFFLVVISSICFTVVLNFITLVPMFIMYKLGLFKDYINYYMEMDKSIIYLICI